MNRDGQHRAFSRAFADYGMLLVLLLLCVGFSVITWQEQHPVDAAAAEQLAASVAEQFGEDARVLIVVRDTADDTAFADHLAVRLEEQRLEVAGIVKGQPIDARRAITQIIDRGESIDAIACNHSTSIWGLFDEFGEKFPTLAGTKIVEPESYHWPVFLNVNNLLNIANQIAVIAIIAIGMTMVIITGGIDLSVGSLIALSAVVTARLIRDYAGAEAASTFGMTACCLGGVGSGALVGLFSGTMVTLFRVPPFIVTLGMMLVASGLAYILADGQSINQVPDAFIWLGRGDDFLGIPNAVVLMLVMYAAAHILMTRMVLGRYIYAVGGNADAARLSGISVRRVLLIVYTMAGALAGLGGVVMASQLKSGTPTYGQMYELYVIAAVVVGGTSLAGGEGKVLGTLIGALIIAVIQNGMNLTGVESYTQKVVLGAVILGAVLLDRIKRGRRA